LCQWRGSRVTGAWLFIIALLKVLSIGDTAPRIEKHAFRSDGSGRTFEI
jgi:hypothetical protein